MEVNFNSISRNNNIKFQSSRINSANAAKPQLVSTNGTRVLTPMLKYGKKKAEEFEKQLEDITYSINYFSNYAQGQRFIFENCHGSLEDAMTFESAIDDLFKAYLERSIKTINEEDYEIAKEAFKDATTEEKRQFLSDNTRSFELRGSLNTERNPRVSAYCGNIVTRATQKGIESEKTLMNGTKENVLYGFDGTLLYYANIDPKTQKVISEYSYNDNDGSSYYFVQGNRYIESRRYTFQDGKNTGFEIYKPSCDKNDIVLGKAEAKLFFECEDNKVKAIYEDYLKSYDGSHGFGAKYVTDINDRVFCLYNSNLFNMPNLRKFTV